MTFLGYNIDPLPADARCSCGREVVATIVGPDRGPQNDGVALSCISCGENLWECDCRSLS